MLEQLSKALPGVPLSVIVTLGILAFAQLALQVVCLIDLLRRSAVRYAPKWVWLLVILFGQLVGPIVYLAAGRAPEPVRGQPSPRVPTGGDAQKALDALYGKPGERA